MQHPNFHHIEHPLIAHKLTLMRRKETTCLAFKQLLHEISLLLGYELTRDLPLSTTAIETPVSEMAAPTLAGERPVIVPILRAGLGMSDALNELMPDAGTGHIGVYRDETTHLPVEYLVKLPPNIGEKRVILVDPMLATGHSAAYAMDVLNKRGVSDRNMHFMALVAAPEGVEHLAKTHPDVPIYTAALDEKLNEKAYIVPGLGDAGDRLFGTL